ncbi:hypothetical protein B4Q13_24560, partial [Lacticaseibacillus rhamnosus]
MQNHPDVIEAYLGAGANPAGLRPGATLAVHVAERLHQARPSLTGRPDELGTLGGPHGLSGLPLCGGGAGSLRTAPTVRRPAPM